MFANMKLHCFIFITILPTLALALRPKDAYEHEAAGILLANESVGAVAVASPHAFAEVDVASTAAAPPAANIASCKRQARSVADPHDERIWDDSMWQGFFEASLILQHNYDKDYRVKGLNDLVGLSDKLQDVAIVTAELDALLKRIADIPATKTVARTEVGGDDDSSTEEVPIPVATQFAQAKTLIDEIFAKVLNPNHAKGFAEEMKDLAAQMKSATVRDYIAGNKPKLNKMFYQQYSAKHGIPDDDLTLVEQRWADIDAFTADLISRGQDTVSGAGFARAIPERSMSGSINTGPWEMLLGYCIPAAADGSYDRDEYIAAFVRDELGLGGNDKSIMYKVLRAWRGVTAP